MKSEIAIVGASGYSGGELLRMLHRHPRVQIGTLFANKLAGTSVSTLYPWSSRKGAFEPYSVEALGESSLVFLALPSGEAMRLAPEIIATGRKVIDLGGDFRLKDSSEYEKYYKRPHTSVGTLESAVYGLPEVNRAKIAVHELIANPGCYPTSVVLPLAPLLKSGVVSNRGVVVSSMSGVSGAGRSASEEFSFTEVNESIRAYKPVVHQHVPEIKAALEAATGLEIGLTFTPHLVPITRGIYTNICAPLKGDITEESVREILEEAYGGEPFVRISDTTPPQIRNVVHTNSIEIGYAIDRDNGLLVLMSAIDNLVKGAAGQAIQNMNIVLGLEETEGLI